MFFAPCLLLEMICSNYRLILLFKPLGGQPRVNLFLLLVCFLCALAYHLPHFDWSSSVTEPVALNRASLR